jgi:putative chitinase
MPVITKENLDKLPNVSTASAERYAVPLRAAMIAYQITTPPRICAFLANVLEESGHFKYVHEIWGPTPQQKKYEPPHQVAKDLGNKLTGDGCRYLGRGLIQLSGRNNYAALSKDLGVDFVNVPRLLELDEYATLSAAWFWNRARLNHLADLIDFNKAIDSPANLINYRAIVRGINGGYTNLERRIDNYKAVKKVMYP